MDLLRYLVTLPVRLANRLYTFLAAVLPPFVGRVTWSPPPWVPAVIVEVRNRQREYVGSALMFAVATLFSWAGWQWYLHRPHPPEPERITFEISTPRITSYEAPDGTPTTVIHPLEVKFSASAAPIELVGKSMTRGITLDPALKGKWIWVDDRTLRFTPVQDWAIGLHDEVRFDLAQVFAPHVLIADDHFAFDMPRFAAEAGSCEFYQDPQNPAAKKTIIQVTFNYPVDPAEFEKRISLKLKGRGGNSPMPLKFTVIYDAAKLKAWVHSQPLDLPRDNDAVELTLDSGVRSSRGGEGTQSGLQMSAPVPGLGASEAQAGPQAGRRRSAL
jgi:alpha-2-macroglobulin